MNVKTRRLVSAMLVLVLIATAVFKTGVRPVKGYSEAPQYTITGKNESVQLVIENASADSVKSVSWKNGDTVNVLSDEDMEYLVRYMDGRVRIDIPGVPAGEHEVTVELDDSTIVASVEVSAYDRSGYAHFNYTSGVGAYNDDGTLKDNAIVLYVTDDTKNTVSVTSADDVTVTGIGNILNTSGKASNGNKDILKKLADEGRPLVVRIVGAVHNLTDVTDPSSKPLINGLTAYGSTQNGGNTKDQGGMARMRAAKDVTIEGIGEDAVIDGWGFHFICDSSAPDYGKSFEVRNLTFTNTPEDAVGMEGEQSGGKLTASVERCWIHNNSFYHGSFTNTTENDKAEGDGSCDFKRGQYLTVAYNYFENCHKTCLVGASDDNMQFNLTYHHNLLYMVASRFPLCRQANVHMYNNYVFGQTDYAMNTRANAYIFSEYNQFYMCKAPQDVKSGAVKSYNDGFSSCIQSSKPGTIVDSKDAIVANECKDSGNNVDYSKFDTDSNLSYIPSGNYLLDEDFNDVVSNVCQNAGALNSADAAAKEFLPWDVQATTVSEDVTLTPGKINKAPFSFELTKAAKVTATYSSDTALSTGLIVNDKGVRVLYASGSVVLEPGTYYVQAENFQPGKNGALGTFKEITINELKFEITDGQSGEPGEEPGEEPGGEPGGEPGDEPGEEPGGEPSGDQELESVFEYNVTESGLAGNDYVVVGADSNLKKISRSYDDKDFTQAIKMESKTSITVSPAVDGTLTLVFNAAASHTVKVDDVKYDIPEDGIFTIDLTAGEHVITKGTTDTHLFYMAYGSSTNEEPEGPGEQEVTYEVDPDSVLTYTEGEDGFTVRVHRSADDDLTFGKFATAAMDGVALSEGEYEKEAGSLILTVKKSALESLAEGMHTLTVVFDDGSLDIEFEVVKSAGADNNNTSENTGADNNTSGNTSADDNNTSGNTVSNNTNSGTTAPKTGDNASVMFFIMILCASGAAIMVTRRKRI